MGTCLKKPEIVYPEKSWENAEIEVKSKFGEVERYESVKGGNGFPFLWKGKFLKVVMKNKRKRAFKAVENLTRLMKHTSKNYVLLPEKMIETRFSIVFVYVKCEMDLITLLNDKDPEPNFRNKIMVEILEAVQHLHRSGFVHRDIKLDNILLQNGKIVLCDNDQASQASEYVKNCGTLHYLPSMDVAVHLFHRNDISMVKKNIWIDCYAIGKTFAQILYRQNCDDDDIQYLHTNWIYAKKRSILTVEIDENDLLARSKWWQIVLRFCKRNEYEVFQSANFWNTENVLVENMIKT